MHISDDEIVRLILIHEGISGKYTNDPFDAGGPTRWGITIPVLSAHRGTQVTSLDIQNLSQAEAEAIYLLRFVAPFANLPDPARSNVIDMGVNAGQVRATILFQQTIGAVPDGQIGAETVRLAHARDWNDLYVGVRLAYYERLIESKPTNKKWRNGWRARALSYLIADDTAPHLLFMADPVFEFTGKAYA
jgi:lysozyme family protein